MLQPVGGVMEPYWSLTLSGGPSRIRTDDLLITNQMLWPTELSGQKETRFLGENLAEKTLPTKCFWLIFWTKEMTFSGIHTCITTIAETAIGAISRKFHYISHPSKKFLSR